MSSRIFTTSKMVGPSGFVFRERQNIWSPDLQPPSICTFSWLNVTSFRRSSKGEDKGRYSSGGGFRSYFSETYLRESDLYVYTHSRTDRTPYDLGTDIEGIL